MDITAKFAEVSKENQYKLPTLYWLPKLHIARSIATSCLTAIKNIGFDTIILLTKETE